MAEKVLVLLWSGSAYDSLRGLLRLAAAEWAQTGVQVLQVELGSPDSKDRLQNALRTGGLAGVLGMSCAGALLRAGDGRSLWEAAEVPYFNWNCDHPCYFPECHAVHNRFLLHGYVFPDHAEYAARHLRANGAAFSAHLGLPPTCLFAHRRRADRNGRILFTKSGGDTNAIEARWRNEPAIVRDTLFAAAESLLGRATGVFLPVLQQVAARHGLHLAGDGALTLSMLRELDAYARFRHANLVMSVARRFPVDVFGTGWAHLDWDGAAGRLGGPLPWEETLRRLPEYLGCLSLNPLVDGSVHDRTFFALSAGVAPLADGNGFSRAHMPLLAPLSFDWDPGSVTAALDWVLARPGDALERTEATEAALQPDFAMARSLRRILDATRLSPRNLTVVPAV